MIALRPWAEQHSADPGEMGEVARTLVAHFDQLEEYVRAVDLYMLEHADPGANREDMELLLRERNLV